MKKKLRALFRLKTLIMAIPAAGLLFVGGLLAVCYVMGPPPLTGQLNTVYYTNDGSILSEHTGSQNRKWVPLENISPVLIQATLAAEDKNFYNHHGFDWKRITAAALKDVKAGQKVEGASTITQQYARNLYLNHDKTWTRKVKEALYSIRLEMFYPKETILEGYLNTIYYGHGAYGIEAASNYYFDKSSSLLNLSEAAMIAGIPKGPSYYSPFQNLAKAEDRQGQILQLLEEEGYTTESEAEAAAVEVLAFSETEDRSEPIKAGYFQDRISSELETILNMDRDEIAAGGFRVYSTYDADKQQLLEQQIANTIPADTELQTGAAAMDPASGAIVALVGGRDYQESSFNRVFQAKRMPGSSFKPFVYYTALGHGFTPVTEQLSEETTFELSGGKSYAPGNYHGYYANEEITLAEAIAMSDNIYAVKTNLLVGADKVAADAEKFGITSNLQEVPSLALGTSPVSVEEMTTAYSRIANGGKAVTGYTVERIEDFQGKVVYEHKDRSKKSGLDEDRLFVLSQLMTGMFDESLGSYMAVTGASVTDQLTRPYAGKSGTTTTDSWMVGFSPQLVMSVWTGYDDNRPLEKVKELRYSKAIWAGFMENAHKGDNIQPFEAPAGVVGVFIDPDSGMLATPYCEKRRFVYFEAGTEPTRYCNDHWPDGEEDEIDLPSDHQPKKRRWFDWLF